MKKPPLFSLGRTVQTANAQATLDPVSVLKSLRRHQTGDWGDCCPEDAEENNRALKENNRLLSVYKDTNGAKFWIITEHDRSVTTVLLPEDY